jgi:curved DNA-binding protein CbpA
VVSAESRQRIIEWDCSLDRLNYEEILGVPVQAAPEVCRQAYYRFAQRFHPDSHRDADPALREALTRVFQRGVEAYRVLTDPELRARWFAARTQGATRLTDTRAAQDIDLGEEMRELHLRCRSAGAILLAKQAHSAFKRGDVAQCAMCLRKALEYEGGANLDIQRCLAAL